MNLLIVEPRAVGHHLALYTRLIVREAVRRKWKPEILTTKTTSAHPAFRLVEKEYGCSIPTHRMKDVSIPGSSNSFRLFLNQFRLHRAIAQGFKSMLNTSSPDKVYVVNLDYFEKALSLLGSPFGDTPFSGMLMNIKFHRRFMQLGPKSRNDPLYMTLFRRLLKIQTLEHLMIVDEAFRSYSNRFSLEENQKLTYVPDVGELWGNESPDQARRALRIDADAFVILVYGSLTKRKGIEQLLNGVSHLGDGRYVILVAGKQDANARDILAGPIAQSLAAKRMLIIRPGFHGISEEYRVFRAADTVWLGYVGGAYGSSGVLFQSASLGIPVLAMEQGLIGWLVKEHNIGLTVDPRSAEEVTYGIKKLAENPTLRKELGINGKRLAKCHTGKEFGERICNSLERSA